MLGGLPHENYTKIHVPRRINGKIGIGDIEINSSIGEIKINGACPSFSVTVFVMTNIWQHLLVSIHHDIGYHCSVVVNVTIQITHRQAARVIPVKTGCIGMYLPFLAIDAEIINYLGGEIFGYRFTRCKNKPDKERKQENFLHK